MNSFIRLKSSLLGMLLIGALLFNGTGLAAEVRLGKVSARPGELVTVLLSIDDTPIDNAGGFSLDLDLFFDPALLSIDAIRIGGLETLADFLFPPSASTPTSSSPIRLDMLGTFPASPGGGTLLELDIQVADSVALGQDVPLDLQFFASGNAEITSASLHDGGITVVPLPAAIWFMLGGLGMLAGTVRRRPTS